MKPLLFSNQPYISFVKEIVTTSQSHSNAEFTRFYLYFQFAVALRLAENAEYALYFSFPAKAFVR
ncbi:hypothetical protein SRABI04_03561 [Chryseobacterium sp. Bi04]|nr:hypothetical protein SRABI04_03561 [Chryseobacterium sp. Bi04]